MLHSARIRYWVSAGPWPGCVIEEYPFENVLPLTEFRRTGNCDGVTITFIIRLCLRGFSNQISWRYCLGNGAKPGDGGISHPHGAPSSNTFAHTDSGANRYGVAAANQRARVYIDPTDPKDPRALGADPSIADASSSSGGCFPTNIQHVRTGTPVRSPSQKRYGQHNRRVSH